MVSIHRDFISVHTRKCAEQGLQRVTATPLVVRSDEEESTDAKLQKLLSESSLLAMLRCSEAAAFGLKDGWF